MAGQLSTHVLDTANGKPASGMKIELWLLTSQRPKLLKTVRTNSNGCTEQPLLSDTEIETGEYELIFDFGEYFQTREFLNRVPVRFTINDPAASYHVPLLCSPWSYMTYRGS
jgi:5-hydroxyisourate hydrolase